jgi:acetate kinase
MKNNILVVNSGSSSLKLCLFTPDGIKRTQQNEKIDFKTAFEPYISESFTAIGHRVVHGGAKYSKSVWVDKDVLKEIEEMSSLSPLHNIPSLNAIQYCREIFPNIPQYAVFDTAFHRNMPEYARIYAIPYALTKKYSIERFGFHGIAHASSYHFYEKKCGPGKVISCHLGGGCSLAAIENGVSIDTSMGFTPNEGLMMATRSGDVDPGIFEFLNRKEGLSIENTQDILNFQSGLLGVSGVSSSMQEVVKSSSKEAQLAVELFCYRVRKTIGAYIAVLQGVDAILFSGGIGENAAIVRKKIIDPLSWIGLEVDAARNEEAIKPEVSNVIEITKSSSKVKSYVIGNDESSFIYEQYKSLN